MSEQSGREANDSTDEASNAGREPIGEVWHGNQHWEPTESVRIQGTQQLSEELRLELFEAGYSRDDLDGANQVIQIDGEIEMLSELPADRIEIERPDEPATVNTLFAEVEEVTEENVPLLRSSGLRVASKQVIVETYTGSGGSCAHCQESGKALYGPAGDAQALTVCMDCIQHTPGVYDVHTPLSLFAQFGPEYLGDGEGL